MLEGFSVRQDPLYGRTATRSAVGTSSGFDLPAALLGTRRVSARRGLGGKSGHFEHPASHNDFSKPAAHKKANRCQEGSTTNGGPNSPVHSNAGRRRMGGNNMVVRRSRGFPGRGRSLQRDRCRWEGLLAQPRVVVPVGVAGPNSWKPGGRAELLSD